MPIKTLPHLRAADMSGSALCRGHCRSNNALACALEVLEIKDAGLRKGAVLFVSWILCDHPTMDCGWSHSLIVSDSMRSSSASVPCSIPTVLVPYSAVPYVRYLSTYLPAFEN